MPDLQKLGLLDDYTGTMDHLFGTYSSLLGPLQSWLKSNFDEKESILEKKAFDTLRGLLPMSTLGQVAFRGNAQAFEYLINRSAKHTLGELRWFARELKGELDKEIPSLLLRVSDDKSQDYQSYLTRRYDGVRRFSGNTGDAVGTRPEVRLVEVGSGIRVEDSGRHHISTEPMEAGIRLWSARGSLESLAKARNCSQRTCRSAKADGTRSGAPLKTRICDSKS
jgi:hypothetical protein